MRKLAPVCVALFVCCDVSAQIIKKRLPQRLTRLDSIFLRDEHFRMETLDSAYRYFAGKFNVSITYDTLYARRHYLNYWFSNTPLSRAIEISTREQRLRYSIDSVGNVVIRRSGKVLAEDTVSEQPPVQVKYAGAATKKNFILSGRVIDFETGEPLAGATLLLPGSAEIYTTSNEGHFIIPNVTNDTITITTSKVGYKVSYTYLNPGVETRNLVIEMEQATKTKLEEVSVIAKRPDIVLNSEEHISAIKMTPAKLAELPNVGEKDVMRGLQLMPGVSAANESSSGLYVRGGTPDQNLVLYDGYIIYHVDHLYGFFSAFNANAMKDVQLYKGGFDAIFGGRLSSVTEITGKEADKKKFNLGADISLLSGNIFTEIPVSEKISITAALRRSWKGPIYNWIFNKVSGTNSDESASGPGGATTETNAYFFDLNTKVNYRANKNNEFIYSYFYSTDKVDKVQSFSFGSPPGGGGAPPGGGGGNFGANDMTDLTTFNNRGMSMQWMKKWGKHLKSSSAISYSNFFSDRNRTNERTTTDSVTAEETTVKTGVIEHNNLKDVSLKTQFDWETFSGNTLTLGAFASYYDIKYTYSQDDTSTILDRQNYSTMAGLFLQNRYRFLKQKAELKPGIRASYFEGTGKYYFEPRFAASYKLLPGLTAKGAYGHFYQFVNQITRDDVLSGSSEFWTLADKTNVPVSKAIHYIGGLSYDVNDYLFSAEGYYKQLTDITQYSMRFSSVLGSKNYTEHFFTGQGYTRGIELMAQKKTGKLTGWVSYTLGQAYNQFDVYGASYLPANQDVTNEFKIVGIYKLGKWDYSATWIFASGRPYTAPGGSYQVTLLDGTVKDYFTVTSQNSLRLPSYHRLDVAVNRHFYNDKGKEIGYLGLSLFNAYNRTNIWYKQFYVSGSEITEVNVNYLGITPNLTLSLKMH